MPAGALDLLAIAVALQIDYGQPIAIIQRQIEALRMMRIRYTQSIVRGKDVGFAGPATRPDLKERLPPGSGPRAPPVDRVSRSYPGSGS